MSVVKTASELLKLWCPRQDSNLRPSAPETAQTRLWQVIAVRWSAAVDCELWL